MKFNLKQKLYFMLISILAVIVVFSLWLMYSINYFGKKNDYLFSQIVSSYTSISEIQNKINLKRIHEVLYINGIDKENQLDVIRNLRFDLDKELNKYEGYDASQEDIDNFMLLKKMIYSYDMEMDSQKGMATSEFYTNSLAKFNEIFSITEKLIAINDGYLQDFNTNLVEFSSIQKRNAIIFGVSFLLLITSFIYILIKDLIYRIYVINISMDEFIKLDLREGDLCKYISSSNFKDDELGALMLKIREFRVKISSVIHEAQINQNLTLDFINSMSESVKNNANSMQISQDNMSQLVTALNEISSTAAEVSSNISQSAELTIKTMDQSDETKEIVNQTAISIKETNKNLENCNRIVGDLQGDSDRISTVLEMISNVAEQTNLLALNAAIEAARAGEQGRGFAVVADEVRMLAKKTQESTETIEDIIESLQKRANNVKSEVNYCYQTMAGSIESSNNAIRSMNQVTEQISLLTEMEAQIATAAEEQNCVINEININAINVNDITRESYDLSIGLQNEMSSIQVEVNKLKSVLNEFKVGD
ncbi:methyl-accepting chemotaxis protein [Vibrio vulnificus]|uniref:methyl-accepting chemotaxis protein n=1 Tax=Vibrio vulnificus TaxID=672 RepID=UPI001EECCBC3|nr:methyl-accepting chemotaxis protein [Vibrio vulnificus]MCG6290831.1 methyl-accepting chemotaxis protein [Vibrio vulnificus]MCU8577610.1 methyl-accepting chemotaxis protein [Vibrio vulnificus]